MSPLAKVYLLEGRAKQVIPDGHVLHEFFHDLVSKKFEQSIEMHDPEVANYVSALLTEFAETEHMFKVKDATGRPITDVGQLLMEADPVYGAAPSFDRERQVRKHIGDFTLFLAGMFPESINHYRMRRQRMERFVDFMKAGKESYYIVSKFDVFEYAKVAPMFARLSEHFEECVYGLHCVKNELQAMQHPIVKKTREFIM